MAEERPVSTTPIPVPVPFGAPQLAVPSPLSQTPVEPTPAEPAPPAPPAPAAAVSITTTDDAPLESTGAETAQAEATSTDVTMADAPSTEQAPSPAPPATAPMATSGASPAPARTSTPLRTNGQETSTSRAASQHPDSGLTMPAEAPPHGAPVRQYLNTKVTGVLLEGMKQLAKERPKDPLRALGEFLLQRSKELESSA